ncbi:Cof-type HAD-IIB family hydrolase [Olivibacter ginsenosidimutans]|uniref:Cof-type HAD-IIB family hydrolase n=1 Tax=Olivibacter ginsenosidimutans TaxID=1176537 RepID=A0ABP9CFB2_9SPHI
MNENIKAIFFDIDGTLLGLKSKEIPESTIEAIQQLKRKNIQVIVSTGRSYAHAKFLKSYGFECFITFNGSYCVAEDDEVIFKHVIDPEDIQALYQHLLYTEHFPVGVMTTDNSYISHVTDDVTTIFNLLKLQVPETLPLMEILNKEVLQLNLFVDEVKEQRIINEVLKQCESSRWCSTFIDVNAKGITKRIGMEHFLARHGIDLRNTMAFGDGGNDIQMLHAAGIGIAMANASDRVKQVANYVTTTTEEDGIWRALKRYEII